MNRLPMGRDNARYEANPYAMAARTRKAYAIAEALLQADCNAWLASRMTDNEWNLAAKAAGVKEPSADTRRMVVSVLEDREARIQQGVARG